MKKVNKLMSRKIVPVTIVLLLTAVFLAGMVFIVSLAGESKITAVTKELNLAAGTTARLEVNIEGKNKTEPKLTYTSTNNSVATVSGSGTVTAKREGTCGIMVSTPRGQRLKMGVKVTSEKDSKTIYLTFDDGPTPNTTPEILRILKKYDAKATFFVIGENVNSSPQHLQQIVDEGHTVGVHNYTQDYNKIYKTEKSYLNDFKKTEDLIVKKTGYHPNYWRFPGGGNNDFVTKKVQEGIMKSLHKRGFTEMDWNSSVNDNAGAGLKENFEQSKNSVEITINTGDVPVMLLYDSKLHPNTGKLTEKLLKFYKKKGYAFKGLDEYRGKELCLGKN